MGDDAPNLRVGLLKGLDGFVRLVAAGRRAEDAGAGRVESEAFIL